MVKKEALLKANKEAIEKRLVQFALEDPKPMLYHNEPIWCDGKIVGDLTSGMYGHTIGTCLGMGYVFNKEGVTKELINSSKFEIEVAGEMYRAKASLKSFYDPMSERARM